MFKGSIAQKSVQFPIETVIEPIAGENYSRVMIFCPLSKAAAYLSGVDSPAANTVIELTASNYAALSSGLLLTWLTPFFKAAQAAVAGIALYDDAGDAELSLSVVYENKKMYAYFKFAIEASEKYKDLQVQLSTLCRADPLYSDCWVGTADETVLASTSQLITALTTANSNARVIYHSDEKINPALAQLGCTLARINATGTPVGNSMDMAAFGTIGASGKGDEGKRINLTPVQCAALDAQKIGYVTYVGDGTQNVVTEGSLTLQGESVGANWVKNFITYVCKVKTANFITKMNRFRNNATYQGIITILTDQVRPFLDMGRLDEFAITAPTFDKLPTSGDTITVPDAWQARYVDNVRSVTIFGTLYITQPSK